MNTQIISIKHLRPERGHIDVYTVSIEENFDCSQRFLYLDKYSLGDRADKYTVTQEITNEPIFGDKSITKIETTYNIFVGTKKDCEEYMEYLCSIDFTIERR